MKTSCSWHKAFFKFLKQVTIAFLWQIPWLFIIGGSVFYARLHLNDWLSTYFELALHQQTAQTLQSRLNTLQNNFSVLNWHSVSDYVATLSATAFADAKVSVIHQTLTLLTGFFDMILYLFTIWICGHAFWRACARFRQEKTEQHIAEAVAEKLRPLLVQKESKQN